MGKTITEVSHPGTKKVAFASQKGMCGQTASPSLAIWDLTPKECSVRVREGRWVCPLHELLLAQLFGRPWNVWGGDGNPGPEASSSIPAPALLSIIQVACCLAKCLCTGSSLCLECPSCWLDSCYPFKYSRDVYFGKPFLSSTVNRLTCGPQPLISTMRIAFLTAYLGNK